MTVAPWARYDLGLASTPLCQSQFFEDFARDHYNRWPQCFQNNGARLADRDTAILAENDSHDSKISV
jgi:hypothetical protein